MGTVTFGAIGTGASGSTTVAPSYPTGITAGQYLLCHVTSGATNSETPSTPSGWTLLATGASTDGSFGIDTGPRRATVFGKIADGTETGTLTVSITNGNTCRGSITRWTNSGGTWDVTGVGGNDSTSGTGVSITFGTVPFGVGDCVAVTTGQRVDTATLSAQSLTASGITFGTRTNRADTAITTGNDHRHVVDTWAAVTAGTGTVAPTWAYTASASVSAGAVLVRLRDVDVVPPVVSTKSWRWYTDATPDGSMVALAAENTVPTLSGTQMQNQVIRLRVQVEETGGVTGTLTDLRIQMSVNNTTWQEIQAQTPVNNLEGIWFRHGNGAATNGGTIGSNLLTGTGVSGTYIEDKTSDPSITASTVKEFDFAIYVHWPRPDTLVRFRLVWGPTPTVLAPAAGSTQIQLQTSTAANRPYTITAMDPDAAQQTCREIRFGAWPRIFWDPGSARWWFFTVQYNTPTQLQYFSWDGAGGWSSPSTVTFATDGNQSRHAVCVANGKVYVMFGSSSTTRGLRRGVISGSSITWDAEQTITQSSDRHRHITVDDGGFVWIAGITAATGVWARRATSADSVTAFQAVKTAADAGVVSGDVFAIVGLTSDKALCVWRSGTVLKSATVTDAGGFSAVSQVNATAVADDEDWGMVRDSANGLVYVAHSDSTVAGGNWVLRAFDVAGGTWSTCTSPGVSGQTSDNDGLPMTLDGQAVYVVGTFPNSEGGQDRKLRYIRYSGGGTGGTWGTLTDLTPAPSRCNGDHIASSPVAANGKAIWVWDVCDDGAGDVPGTGFAIEYHYLTLGAGARAQRRRALPHLIGR